MMQWYENLRERLGGETPVELVGTVKRGRGRTLEVDFPGFAPVTFDEDLYPPGVTVVDGDVLAWNGRHHGGVIVSRLPDGTLSVHDESAGRTMFLSFEGVRLSCLSLSDVWATRAPRIGDRLPELPVRSEALAYVERLHSYPRRPGDGLAWEIVLKGGVSARLNQDDIHLEDLIPNANVETFVAVWPPKIIPGWGLYLLCRQGIDLSQDRFRDLAVWFGGPEQPLRELQASKQTWQHERADRDLIAFVLDDNARGQGPRLLQIAGPDPAHCGFFMLLEKTCERPTQMTLGIDFGSSNTVVAIPSQTPGRMWGESLDLKNGELLAPHPVATQGDRAGTNESNEPWIPSVSWALDHSREISQVPTGVLYLSDQRRIPFLDYSIVGPGFEPHQVSNTPTLEWVADLKWVHVHRENFFRVLLTWAIAAAGAPRSITVRASYPLAFSVNARENYHQLLLAVAAKVGGLTGCNVRVASSFFDNSSQAFVDESTPLLRGLYGRANWTIEPFEEGRASQAILVADLGGGTLDLVLGYFNSAHCFRMLAAESVRIGARAICELVARQLGAGHLEESIRIEVVESIARSGRLGDMFNRALSGIGDHAILEGHVVHWEGSPSEAAGEVLKKIGFYYLVIAEYCARFAAGVISAPIDTLTERMAHAPGSRHEPKLSLPVELFTVQTGNGWGFLSSVGELRYWRRVFEKRVAELAPEKVQHVQNAQRIEQFLRAEKKTLVAKNIAAMPAQLLTFGHEGNVAAAPNGFDDGQIPWHTLVGPGSPVAATLPNQQQSEPTTPGFPLGSVFHDAGWNHRGPEIFEDWRQQLELELAAPPSDTLTLIRMRQSAALAAEQHHGRGRMRSAMRILLETAFRQSLGCEILDTEV